MLKEVHTSQGDCVESGYVHMKPKEVDSQTHILPQFEHEHRTKTYEGSLKNSIQQSNYPKIYA